MKNRTPPVWLALTASALLVAFSVTNTMGADPVGEDATDGRQESDFVRLLLFGDPPADGEGKPVDAMVPSPVRATQDANSTAATQVADTTDGEAAAGAAEPAAATETDMAAEGTSDGDRKDNHGACVSAVAKSDAVGDPKNNHGGAVSHAARVTCWNTTDGSGGGSDVAPEGSDVAPEAGPPGNSGNAHQKKNENKPAKADKPPKSK